jgi:hypothetical protein
MYLSPLELLHTVNITVAFLLNPSEGILVSKYLVVDEDSPVHGWTGECDQCVSSMLISEDFREDWWMRKARCIRPPSLNDVTWHFIPYEKMDDAEAIKADLEKDWEVEQFEDDDDNVEVIEEYE